MSADDVALAAQLGQQLLAQVSALESRLESVNAALAVATESKEDAERLAARRAAALAECEQRFQHSAQESEQLFKALSAAEGRVREVELEKKSMQDEWRVASDETRRVAVANESLEAELLELKRSIRSSRQRAATDASAATNDARVADELAAQLNAANARNALLESTVSDAAAEIASLRAALDSFGDLTAQLAAVRDTNADLVRQLADARSEAASLADTVSSSGAANLHHSLSAVDLSDAADGGAGAASVLDELRELMSSPSSVASPPPPAPTTVTVFVETPAPAAAAAAASTTSNSKSGELRMRLQLVGNTPMPWSRRRVTVQAGALIFHGNAVEQTAVQRPDGEPLQLPRQGVLALRGASVKLAPADGGAMLTLGVRHILLDAKSAEAIGATYRFYEFVDVSEGSDDSELLAWASALETAVRDASPAAPPSSNGKTHTQSASSSNATKACVVLVENEYRLSPFHSWRPSEPGGLAAFVSGSDMPHWTTALDNSGTQPKEAFACPSGFVWAADKWSLCEPPNTGLFVSETQARTDLNGWQYSAKWNLPQHKWQAGPSASCSVRRRWWKRTKVAQ
jgi:formiminotetrahydrofolate cyclodeaminase